MKRWGAISQAMHLSWTLLFSLVLPLLGGIWLDSKLGTTPLFVLVGTGLGILAATVGVARIALRMLPRSEDTDAEQQEAKDEEELE